jgi:multiple sugar transport system substrate-binding protein
MKIVRAVLALALVFGLFSFGSAQQQDPEITLTWWMNPWRIRPPGFPADQTPTGEEYMRYIAEEFQALHPNVTVVTEVVPNAGFAEKINTALFAGNPPDILRDLDFNPDWAREGLLEPIDDYLTEEDWADFLDYALEAGRIDDHYYIWPWNNSNNGMGSTLLLNPAIFEERGVELPTGGWTVDEFLDVAQQLTFDRDGDGRTDVYAITLAAQDEHNVLGWLHRFGATLLNEDASEFVLNSPEGVQALQLMVDMIHEYGIAPAGAEGLGVYDTINNLHTGRAAMGYGGIYEIGRIARSLDEGLIDEAIEVVIAPFPHDPEVGPVAYETSGGFIVFRQPDDYRRDMAMELARFITNRENMALLEDLLYVTARQSVNESLTFESVQAYADVRPNVEVYLEAISHGVPYFGPREVNVGPAIDYLRAAVQAALSRQMTPQQALDQFVENANRVVFGN